MVVSVPALARRAPLGLTARLMAGRQLGLVGERGIGKHRYHA
jgi:hypothetical protein